jgi:diacylglycerol kinase family enzyme
MIGKIGKFDVILNLSKVFDGRILTHPKVKSFKGKKIGVHSSEKFILEADGESLGCGPFEFGIIPLALKVFSGGADIYPDMR